MPDRPDPVTDRLARFTPNPAGLDRDALLFAAGRKSARPMRFWPIATGLLAASQVITLALLWPGSPAQPLPTQVAPAIAPSSELSVPPVSRPPDVLTAGSSPDVVLSPPSAGTTGEFVLSGPPLTVGSGLPID